MEPNLAPSIRHKNLLNILGFGTAVSLLGDATLYTVLPNPTIASQVGVSLGMVGVLLGANRAVRLLLNGPVGVIYDRMPRRGLMVSSLLFGTLANLCYALGSGFWPLLAGRIAWGSAWALLWIGGNAVVLDISSEEDRGRNSGRYQMWFMFGVAFSSFIGGLLTDLLGFRGTMWLTTGMIGAAALLWLFVFPETRSPDPHIHNPNSPDADAGEKPSWNFAFKAGIPVFTARFVGWGVLAATMILWLEPFIGSGLRVRTAILPLATVTGALTALTMLFSMGAAPLAGWISDKLGKRWGVISASVAISAVGIWLMSGSAASWALLGAFLAQIISVSVETLIPAITGDRVGNAARGRTLGMIYTFGDLGSTLGPPAALMLLETEALSLPNIYRLCVLLLVFVAWFAWRQRRID